jgi:hypothetical protein
VKNLRQLSIFSEVTLRADEPKNKEDPTTCSYMTAYNKDFNGNVD